MSTTDKDPKIVSNSHSSKSGDSGKKTGIPGSILSSLKQSKLSRKEQASFFNIFVLTSYVLSDMIKKPKAYRIGIFTVTITVTFVILLYSILDILPVVFLKQAQDQVGESDFIYTSVAAENVSQSGDYFMYDSTYVSERKPLSNFSLPVINGTELFSQTQNAEDFEGFTARWYGVANFANVTNPDLYASGLIMVLDTEKEVKIGLGREFTKRLLGESQSFVTHSALKYLGIEPNGKDKIQLVVDIRKYLALFLDTNLELTNDDIIKILATTGYDINESDSYTVRAGDLVNTTQLSGKGTIIINYSIFGGLLHFVLVSTKT